MGAGDRDGNEFAITAAARELASVVAPIAIYDVDRDLRMKLMVTEWSARATRLVDLLINPRHPPGQALIVGTPCRDIELNVIVDGEKQLKAGKLEYFNSHRAPREGGSCKRDSQEEQVRYFVIQ